MIWDYKSENVGGNLHEAAAWINERHPYWDVVAMENVNHSVTVVVYRIERKPQ